MARRSRNHDEREDRGVRRKHRKPSAIARNFKRLLILVVLVAVIAFGYVAYKAITKAPDRSIAKSLSAENLMAVAKDTGKKIQSSAEDALEKARKISFSDLQDWLKKNPDVKPIETEEQLNRELERPDEKVASRPSSGRAGRTASRPARAPAPASDDRSKALAGYNKARSILRSGYDNRRLRRALGLLDTALRHSQKADDENLIAKINSLRYFCMKHQTVG